MCRYVLKTCSVDGVLFILMPTRPSPRYRMRPKFHQFHCSIVLRMAGISGSRLNPRVTSCYMEEDYIGHLMAALKRSIHPSTLSKRVLQRWILQFNAWLAQREVLKNPLRRVSSIEWCSAYICWLASRSLDLSVVNNIPHMQE